MIELTERVGAEPKVIHENDESKKKDKKPEKTEDETPAKE